MTMGEERSQTTTVGTILTPPGTEVWPNLSLLIGGELTEGRGDSIDVIDPATERVVASVAAADRTQADRAVTSAREAFESGPWASASAADRSALINRIADGIEKRRDEFVNAIVTEVGAPISAAGALQVDWPIKHLREYAQAALDERSQDLGRHTDPIPSSSIVAYRPVGVVAAIAAYNYPLLLLVHKLGAALAAGCTVVAIPSPRTPLSTLLLAEVLRNADVPPGVVNIVVGEADIARAVTENPGVDKIAFTGSVAVGEKVMRQAATGVRGVVLELGGKSPAILLPGTDLTAVVPGLHQRYCRNGGQACAAPTRILVHESQWVEFIELSHKAYESIQVGDPRDPATIVGPMITEAHRDSVEQFIREAVDGGAVIAAGGGRPDSGPGWFVNPALITNVHNTDRICQEEIFGPVATAMPYSTVDGAVKIANETRYGLHAYLFGPDTDAAREIAPRLRAGTVSVNGGGGLRADAPMGGFGASGVGREIGSWGIHEYLEPQHIQWACD
ncbi:aldehyde dehydrogenase family protein [Rhodococcus sp. NPDC127530]|uniref:aldehyde dehydrogenase family protein n=2 Tax=unclassified Rhodococcus (in: high G+C Gram-positive bacteria) TaxID=192944 RepID=UPI0036261ED5